MDPITIVILSLTAVCTSIITASIGIGGGLALVSVMALMISPLAVIPVHAIVQLTSNVTRMLSTPHHIKWRIVLHYAIGAVAAAAIGSQIVVRLDEHAFALTIGVLILVMVWLPKPKRVPRLPYPFFYVGGASTLMSFFVGGSGPLVAPFLRHACPDRFDFVATESACQVWTHSLKIAVFGFAVGVSFKDYWVLIACMMAGAIVGTWLGLKILGRMSERIFQIIFKVVITTLALILILKTVL